MSQIKFRAELVHPSAWIDAGSDTDPIHMERCTNIQDGCILHTDPGFPSTIGDGVTIGHGAIIHGATVENDVLIGMRAVVMNGARIGIGSIVGTGAVVTEAMQIPPGSLVLGLPGKVARSVGADELGRIRATAARYVQRFKGYRNDA
jgi:carbonic anhydrase/acetyltransferase-like protein (isoleucine patch superfamily)